MSDDVDGGVVGWEVGRVRWLSSAGCEGLLRRKLVNRVCAPESSDNTAPVVLDLLVARKSSRAPGLELFVELLECESKGPFKSFFWARAELSIAVVLKQGEVSMPFDEPFPSQRSEEEVGAGAAPRALLWTHAACRLHE